MTKIKKYILVFGSCGIIFLSGCSSYNVLDKVADTKTVGESISEIIERKLDNETANIQYLFRSISSDEKKEYEIEELGERPTYDASKYVDTSKCNIGKAKKYTAKKVTEKDVNTEIRNLMLSECIFSNNEKSRNGDIVNIDYTATEVGQNKPFVNIKNEDRIIGDNLFPAKINNKLINVKKGDVIDIKYSYPNDYYDNTYKGKTYDYHIVVNEVKGMSLTDEVARELSKGAVVTAVDYLKYATSMLNINRENEAAQNNLLILENQCVITGYPEDVLNYDIQAQIIKFYQLNSISNKDDINEKIKSLGYKNVEELAEEIRINTVKNLEDEMKIFALAEKYNVMPDSHDNNEVNNTYDVAKENLVKEIQEYGRKSG